jgi:hypothetical protein
MQQDIVCQEDFGHAFLFINRLQHLRNFSFSPTVFRVACFHNMFDIITEQFKPGQKKWLKFNRNVMINIMDQPSKITIIHQV